MELSPPSHLELQGIFYGQGSMRYAVQPDGSLVDDLLQGELFNLGYILKASGQMQVPQIDISPQFTRSLRVGKIREYGGTFKLLGYEPKKVSLTANKYEPFDGTRYDSGFRQAYLGDPTFEASYYKPDSPSKTKTGLGDVDRLLIRVSTSLQKKVEGTKLRRITLPFTGQYYLYGRPKNTASANWWEPERLCRNA